MDKVVTSAAQAGRRRSTTGLRWQWAVSASVASLPCSSRRSWSRERQNSVSCPTTAASTAGGWARSSKHGASRAPHARMWARTRSSLASISPATSSWSWCRRARWLSGCARAVVAYPPSSRPRCVGTQVADGGLPWRYDAEGSVAVASPRKEVREYDGAGLRSWRSPSPPTSLWYGAARGDSHGNLVFDKCRRRNFNPLAAMAGRVTIAEVEELLEPGELAPDTIHLPGVFVQWGSDYDSGSHRQAHREDAARAAHTGMTGGDN
ncbi:hypothetical protein SANTM175S_08098 [Streptomyces antimycoticus]